MESSKEDRGGLGELALVFLRMGATAFGGPAAHIAIMENEVVRRRRWLTPSGSSICSAPRTSSPARARPSWRSSSATSRRACRAAPRGRVLHPAGGRHGRRARLGLRALRLAPAGRGVLYGIKPVVIAVVVQALWGLAPKAIRSPAASAAVGVVGVRRVGARRGRPRRARRRGRVSMRRAAAPRTTAGRSVEHRCCSGRLAGRRELAAARPPSACSALPRVPEDRRAWSSGADTCCSPSCARTSWSACTG